MQKLRKAPSILLAAACWAAVPLSAGAVELLPGAEIHGYGNITSQRDAVSPQAKATVEHDVSLLGTFQVFEGGRLWAQLNHLSTTDRVRLDLLFLDWELGAQTTLRVGQERLPTGVFNETRDVQSLRASASLPLLYAGDPVAIDKALRGVALDHRFAATALGSLGVEAFAGWALVPEGEDAEPARLVGGRLTWTTPVEGLTFKLSGYTGHLRLAEPDQPANPLEQAMVASARYERGPWVLTAEAARSHADGHLYNASYVQADRQLAPAWRGFVRAESVRDSENGANGEEPRHRRRLALGAAWDAQHWGLRLEAARNRGRLAELPDSVAPETLRARWNDYRASVNYIF